MNRLQIAIWSGALWGGLWLLVGCTPDPQVLPTEGRRDTCVESKQCPRGEVCREGLCIIGECVVRSDCPHPWDQLCNELNRCIPDPESPIGNECPNGTSDCDMGEFCSAGSCYVVSESSPCNRSSQCDAGERCDPVNRFCVEDRGGCNRVDEYPELACPTGEVCDAVTGHCDPPMGLPCSPETVEADCGIELMCIGNRCVQCTANANCGVGENICCDGFGTQCNIATGRCVSAFLCSTHEDCTGCRARPGLDERRYCSDGQLCTTDDQCESLSGRRCATSTGECILPECEEDDDCSARMRCDLSTLRCYLPPAECPEDNEPNNSLVAATVATGNEHTDALCRGDIDYVQIQGHAGTRLRVSVAVSPNTYDEASGITVALLDNSGSELDSGTFGWSTEQVRVSADVAVSAPYYVRLTGGAAESDVYTYTITVVETEPLQCGSEPGEPNDSLQQAVNSPLQAGNHARALCGTSDEDYHQLTAPPSMRLAITVSFLDSEGDIGIELLTLGGDQLDHSDSYSGDLERVVHDTGDSEETVVLHVDRYIGYGAFEEEQEYVIEVKIEEPPDCDDGFEPNNNATQATPVVAGTYAANICSMDDTDIYAILLPAGGDITVAFSFLDAEGDLDARLFDENGDSVDTSGTTSNIETVMGTGLASGVYYAELYPWSGTSPEPDRQPYTVEIAVDHNCMDDELEGSGNDVLNRATPLRDEALESFVLDAQLKLCGGGSDWYRFLMLGDEFAELRVQGAPGLVAELYRMQGGAPPAGGGRAGSLDGARGRRYLSRLPCPGTGGALLPEDRRWKRGGAGVRSRSVHLHRRVRCGRPGVQRRAGAGDRDLRVALGRRRRALPGARHRLLQRLPASGAGRRRPGDLRWKPGGHRPVGHAERWGGCGLEHRGAYRERGRGDHSLRCRRGGDPFHRGGTQASGRDGRAALLHRDRSLGGSGAGRRRR